MEIKAEIDVEDRVLPVSNIDAAVATNKDGVQAIALRFSNDAVGMATLPLIFDKEAADELLCRLTDLRNEIWPYTKG